MEPRRISAVDHHPVDLRAAHSNVPEHAVIERMKLAYRRDACAADVVGAPPFAGRGTMMTLSGQLRSIEVVLGGRYCLCPLVFGAAAPLMMSSGCCPTP